ncbi:helix-turn-helix transcriptional regulator [Pseudoclavibacter sp. CFCC 13796]|uniref:helix-turn-helix domain-containing protein n=1 Tax=Pseudoclavibacter sp. CFCC 13796 TaxID=2615179 RepID=UPI001300E2C2|nr:helix-turn-helix transcriptional regulator [Pseudoclavibacter sp. CFCC 13796]KAB1661683.1 helix-turn-helix transcriptional regulator [Pseudoclavibacter sp. CFCC 13796]
MGRPLKTMGMLGGRVATLREQRGLTQHQLAAKAHVSRSWLAQLELGKPAANVRLIMAVLDALDAHLEVNDD